MAAAESAAFSGAEVLTSHSVVGDFGACGAGAVGSITSAGTGEIAAFGLDRDAVATGFRFLLMSREHGGPKCRLACLAEQCAGEHRR